MTDSRWHEVAMRPCSICERETEHALVDGGFRDDDDPRAHWHSEEWECECQPLHTAARTSLEAYVDESIREALRRMGIDPNVTQRQVITDVSGLAANHVEMIMEVEG